MRNHLRSIVGQARESGRSGNQPASSVLAAEAVRLARAAAAIHLTCATNSRAMQDNNDPTGHTRDLEDAAARAAMILSEARR